MSVTLDFIEIFLVEAAGTHSMFYIKPKSHQNREFPIHPVCRWLNRNFSIEKIIKNFLVALNLLEVKQLRVSKEDATCGKLTGIKFKHVTMVERNRPIFDRFYRDSDSLTLYDRALLGEQTRAIFSENVNSLVLIPSFVVDFNDLLAINATKVDIGRSFTLSNLNLFLRHFINGSNPRLKEIHVSLKGNNLEDFKTTLLNSIKYWTSSISKTYEDGRSIDGLGFLRIDGVEVTIFVDPIRHSYELTC